MGCGCNKGKALPKARKNMTAPIVVEIPAEPKVFVNQSDKILQSRNPRFKVQPGDKITLDASTINLSVRNWIRRGELVAA